MGDLKGLRQRHPPIGDGADDVERGAESGVGEQQAAAAVDDVGVPVEGEELQVALLEIATAGGARESRLLGVGVAVVEHGGGEQRQPPQEVVVGDEAAPGSGNALEPEQGLQREPGEDLHEHIVAHGHERNRRREVLVWGRGGGGGLWGLGEEPESRAWRRKSVASACTQTKIHVEAFTLSKVSESNGSKEGECMGTGGQRNEGEVAHMNQLC
ncbi:hypothetical protein MUK42_36270 [Musa troglodytarum]|uniref:Uncharacterized protein n=1 Tax=Musa troglodytarum TaxID=320322 RepID=A0A9E7J9Q9_9LILI|nr:hypothetical protein MUK42_36270 [Musa troglodytarum]